MSSLRNPRMLISAFKSSLHLHLAGHDLISFVTIYSPSPFVFFPFRLLRKHNHSGSEQQTIFRFVLLRDFYQNYCFSTLLFFFLSLVANSRFGSCHLHTLLCRFVSFAHRFSVLLLALAIFKIIKKRRKLISSPPLNEPLEPQQSAVCKAVCPAAELLPRVVVLFSDSNAWSC